MDFLDLLFAARDGNENAAGEIFKMLQPMISNNARIGNRFDEDLFQELSEALLISIRKFPLSKALAEIREKE